MDNTNLVTGKHKLKQNLAKSLAKVRLSKQGKLTSIDKSNLKKAVVSTVQGFLKAELKRTNTKTYDWYFFKEVDRVYHIEAMRNELMHNRYFIVDNEGKEALIGNMHSFGSTVGQERIRQFDITSKEIGDIISSSAKLFADMMKITVSEKEDGKIWKAYDTVDEKKIIIVTIGLPAVIIASAEAVPLMIIASKSSAASMFSSTLGKAFALNSGRQMAINGGSNLLEQYSSNAMAYGEFGLSNFKKIDIWDFGTSTVFGNWGNVPLKSAIDFNANDGFRVNSLDKFTANVFSGGLKFKAGKAFGNTVGNTLGKLTLTYGGLLNQGGQFTIKTTIETFNKKSNENDN